MTISEMKRIKKKTGITYEEIAVRSGVPLSTVQKVFSGRSVKPRKKTAEALEGVFRLHRAYARDAAEASEDRTRPGDDLFMLRETSEARAYDVPGRHTIEDYIALPEEQRLELIDGVFYDMAAPTVRHQLFIMRLSTLVRNHIDQKGGDCLPVPSPVDVQLDEDEYTCVQPDFLVLCDRSKIKNGRIFGAPDWIIEILSPSTAKKDTTKKLQKYGEAGVKEYWVVDPDGKRVVVYDFTQECMIPSIYGFDAQIPVSLFSGELMIDFKIVYEELAFTYEEQRE